MPSIDAVCGCAITRADRQKDIAHLTADLAKLDKIKATQPKRYARSKVQYDLWRQRLESRIAALRAEMEAIDAHA